jgi:outer membrane protein TolC
VAISCLLTAALFSGIAPAQPAVQALVSSPPGLRPVELALSMDEAVVLALQTSFRVSRSDRSVEMARLRADMVGAQLKPRIDTYLGFNEALRGASFYENPYRKGKSDPSATSQVSLNAVLTMPIDVSGNIGRQVQQAQLSVQSASIQAEQSAIEIHADIRSTYADALRAQGAVDADEAVVGELRGLIERAKGLRPEAVPFLAVELSNAEQLLSMSRSAALVAQSGLRQQLRLPDDTVLRLTSSLDPNVPRVPVDKLLEKALAQRSDVRDTQLRLQQAELALAQSRDARRPTAHVFAFLNQSYSGMNPGQLSTNTSRSSTLMLNVNLPLAYWDNGNLNKSERMALLSLEQVRDDGEEQRARIASELRLLTINLSQAQRRLASLPSAQFALASLRQAEEAVLSHADWQGQLAQVTNARNSWRMTHTASIDALADFYSAYFRLMRSIGER